MCVCRGDVSRKRKVSNADALSFMRYSAIPEQTMRTFLRMTRWGLQPHIPLICSVEIFKHVQWNAVLY